MYIALGALHSLYNPIPGKFKDYIAIPKANGYQSLHNTLWGPYGTPIEVQIRTPEMHRIAEAGVASHWLYKSTDADLNDLHMKTHQWLQGLLETLSDSTDSLEFLEHLKVDLFPGEVYVFTPQGKILALPKESTAVDFAYAVHTDIGDCCVAAKINGENAPLRTILRSGDRVEIVTASHAKPNPAWLNYVGTGKARSHIRRFLKTMQYEESAKLGERLLNQALISLKVDPETISEAQWEKLARESGAKSRTDLLADMGRHAPAGSHSKASGIRESPPPGKGGGGTSHTWHEAWRYSSPNVAARSGGSIVGSTKKIRVGDYTHDARQFQKPGHWKLAGRGWGQVARHFDVISKGYHQPGFQGCGGNREAGST